ELVDDKPQGEGFSVKFSDEHNTILLSEYTQGQAKDEYNWKVGKYLVHSYGDNIKSYFYFTDDVLYNGELKKNEDAYELNGQGIVIYNDNNYYIGSLENNVRKGNGEFRIVKDDFSYVITGTFDKDAVKKAKVEKATEDKSTTLFEGEF